MIFDLFTVVKYSILSVFTLTPLLAGLLNPQIRNTDTVSFFGERVYEINEYFFCQPANGWTSLAFIVPSFISLWDVELVFSNHNMMILLFVVCNYMNYLGNLAYHTFCIDDGIHYDGMGMVCVLSFIISKTFTKIFYKCLVNNYILFWLYFITCFAITNPFILNVSDAERIYRYTIPTIILVEIMYSNIEENKYLPNIYGLLAFLSFIAGYILWEIQQNNDPTGIDSWFQFHALWHLFCSLSLSLVYFMYKIQDHAIINN